jgi:hypothetical protein
MGGMRMTARGNAARVTALAISLWLGMTCAVAADRAKVLKLQRAYAPDETRAFTRAWLLFKSGL